MSETAQEAPVNTLNDYLTELYDSPNPAPVGVPPALALIAHIAPRELDGAVDHTINGHRKLEIVRGDEQDVVASASAQKEFYDENISSNVRRDDAARRLDEARETQRQASREIVEALPMVELAKDIQKRQKRMSAPVRWGASLACVAVFAFAGTKVEEPERSSPYTPPVPAYMSELGGASAGTLVGGVLVCALSSGSIARMRARRRVAKAKSGSVNLQLDVR